MISLEEIYVSPMPDGPRDTSQSPPDGDHDSDDDDDGERALLGENTQTRWTEKPLSIYLWFWKQTSGIIVEVSVSSFRSSVSNPGTLRHYRRSFSQRWAVCLRESYFLKYPYVKLFLFFVYFLSYTAAALESDDQC